MSNATLKPHKGPQEDAFKSDADIVITGGANGGGKGQPLDGLVWTPWGRKQMGELEVGSKVLTADGSPCEVVRIYELGLRDIYRVSFTDGSSLRVTSDHLWLAWKVQRGVASQRIYTTDKLKKGMRIPVCGELVSNRFDYTKIDPYSLGVLLGDGCFRGNNCGVSVHCDEILDRLQLNLTSNQGRDYYVSGIKPYLEELGLWGCKSHQKFIPDQYKFLPLPARWELLRGIMDADGTATECGKIRFSSTSEQLAFDVRDLVETLGGVVTSITSRTTDYTHKGERKTGRVSYRLNIKMPQAERVFGQTKKSNRTRDFQSYSKAIESVKLVGQQEARCISVSHPSQLYVAGERPIVTHNTWTVIAAPVPCFKDPNFQGVIFRRTMPQIKNPGSILQETSNFYPRFGGSLNRGDFVWHLPKGGQLKLAGIQHPGDEEAWDGAQLMYAGFDQLEQFEQRQFFYMLGRLRSANGMFKPFCFASCNPAPLGHWLGEFLGWWIGDDGFPIPERSGKKRYFFGSEDGWEWAEEGDVKTVEMDGKQVEIKPLSVTFIPSKVTDNPSIMKNNPEYLQMLNGLDYVDRMRKLYGNWTVSSKNGLFQRHNIQIVDERAIPRQMPIVRAWDIADTEPTAKNPTPCYTAGAKCGMTWEEFLRCNDCQRLTHNPYVTICPDCGKENLYKEVKEVLWILDMARFQLQGGEKKRRMQQIAYADGKGVRIWVEQEPGSAGKDIARQYIQETFREFQCQADRPTGNKEVRASAWVAAAEEGRIRVLDGEFCIPMLREVEAFPSATFKDQVDALSLAYVKLREYRAASWSARWGMSVVRERPQEFRVVK